MAKYKMKIGVIRKNRKRTEFLTIPVPRTSMNIDECMERFVETNPKYKGARVLSYGIPVKEESI